MDKTVSARISARHTRELSLIEREKLDTITLVRMAPRFSSTRPSCFALTTSKLKKDTNEWKKRGESNDDRN